MRIGVSPILVAVGRVLRFWVGWRRSEIGQERKFGTETAPP